MASRQLKGVSIHDERFKVETLLECTQLEPLHHPASYGSAGEHARGCAAKGRIGRASDDYF